jgi:hypothetical protein
MGTVSTTANKSPEKKISFARSAHSSQAAFCTSLFFTAPFVPHIHK